MNQNTICIINFKHRLRNYTLLLCLLYAIPSFGQSGYKKYDLQVREFKDSIESVSIHNLSDSLKCLHILNTILPRLHVLNTPTRSEKLAVLGKYTDSATFWATKAKCKSCITYIELVKANYLPDIDSIIILPQIPKWASKSLKLHYLCSSFNYRFKKRETYDLNEIREIVDLLDDKEIGYHQRMVVADIIATNYFYQISDYETCSKLFNIATKNYENGTLLFDPWKVRVELPGVVSLPIQKISRSYLNGGLVAEKLGDYKTAFEYMKKGSVLYKETQDTMGLLWAYRDLSKAYSIQQDYDNAFSYIDSTLTLINQGSTALLGVKLQRYSDFLFTNSQLANDPITSERFFGRLKTQLKDKESFPEPTTMELLHYAFLELNIQAHDLVELGEEFDLVGLQKVLAEINEIELGTQVYNNNLRSLIIAQFAMVEAYLNTDSPDFKNYQRTYRLKSLAFNLDEYKEIFYDFAKPFLITLEDQNFLLELNRDLLATANKATNRLSLVNDRFLAWEAIGSSDSALFYHKAYSSIKDSIVNRENYMKLAKADLDLKNLERQKASDQLRIESYSNKQSALISGILAISFLLLALLFIQRRIRDRIRNEKKAELLALEAETEIQKNVILASENKLLEKELHSSIIEAMHNQNRNIELAEIIEELQTGAESSFVDRKTKELKRKLNEISSEEILHEIERKAIQLYPDLYDYLQENLSARNKNEILLCIMMMMNYTTEDIARLLKRSEKAVKSLRYRVRKRLLLEESDDLKAHLKSKLEQNYVE